MQLLVITLLLLIALSSIEARGSKLPTKAGYKTERANVQEFKAEVVAAAPVVAKSSDLEANFYKLTAGMFSFFACGMLVGQNRMYGPKALSPLLQYWSNDNGGAVTEWFGRFFGIAMLVFMTGPKFFGVPMAPWLKQSMVFNLAGLGNMANVYFGSPDEVTQMWVPQLILQVGICLVNYKLISK